MTSNVGLAYDVIAPDYDRLMRDEWVRSLLWRRYLACFSSGDHVLDVACGTGIDSIFLAEHDISVTGVDVSPGMIAQFQAKIEQRGLRDRVEGRVLDVTELDQILPNRFDGIISAFAGLNTVSDLSAFAESAARLLRPDGVMIVHMLNRTSVWERLSLIARGRLRAAAGLNTLTERVVNIGGQAVKHHVYRPDEVYDRFFAAHFRTQRLYGVSVCRPSGVSGLPTTVLEVLGWLDWKLGGYAPFVNWGRFFVLELVKLC